MLYVAFNLCLTLRTVVGQQGQNFTSRLFGLHDVIGQMTIRLSIYSLLHIVILNKKNPVSRTISDI